MKWEVEKASQLKKKQTHQIRIEAKRSKKFQVDHTNELMFNLQCREEKTTLRFITAENRNFREQWIAPKIKRSLRCLAPSLFFLKFGFGFRFCVVVIVISTMSGRFIFRSSNRCGHCVPSCVSMFALSSSWVSSEGDLIFFLSRFSCKKNNSHGPALSILTRCLYIDVNNFVFGLVWFSWLVGRFVRSDRIVCMFENAYEFESRIFIWHFLASIRLASFIWVQVLSRG